MSILGAGSACSSVCGVVALCECGCGEPAPIATHTYRRRGYAKGQPQRFILGHCRKPYSGVSYREQGRKRIHVLRAERALGKALPAGTEVHHADGSRSDTAPLVICQDKAYHKLLHVRMRIKAAGGNPNTDAICGRCRQVKPRESFSILRRRVTLGINTTCRSCEQEMKHAR